MKSYVVYTAIFIALFTAFSCSSVNSGDMLVGMYEAKFEEDGESTKVQIRFNKDKYLAFLRLGMIETTFAYELDEDIIRLRKNVGFIKIGPRFIGEISSEKKKITFDAGIPGHPSSITFHKKK